MNWQIAPPVAEPVLLQPSAFLFPLFALLHLVQFPAPAQPSQHGKRIARGFALRGIHTPWTHSLQFSNLVFELLNLKQGQNKALWCSESVVKLFSCCTIATNYRLLAFYVEATLKCHDATKLVEPWVSNDQPQAKTSTKMFQLNMVWWMWKIPSLVSWIKTKGTSCASLWKLLSLSFHL